MKLNMAQDTDGTSGEICPGSKDEHNPNNFLVKTVKSCLMKFLCQAGQPNCHWYVIIT